jgi:hypothetical protein
MANSHIWVADDGSFGAWEVVKFDTSRWTKEDFEEVENASDFERLEIAQRIDKERNSE